MKKPEEKEYKPLSTTDCQASPRQPDFSPKYCRFRPLCGVFVILVLMALGVLAFRLYQHTILPMGCPMKFHGASWGIYLDGRDAIGGRCAYGCAYAGEMDKRIEQVYQMLENESLPENGLTMQHVLRVKSILNQGWRKYPNPVSNGVQYCHSHVLEPQQISSIMAHVMVMDKQYEPRTPLNYTMVISELLQTYNEDIAKASTPDDRLASIAWLLQNLAFLHPLGNQNGRSRLLLLQFELRRLKIACGTMMFNNNKNIYFETPNSFTARIKEGIDIYEASRARGFSFNPWRDNEVVDHHFSMFALPNYTIALEACWRKFCAPQPNKLVAAAERAQLGLSEELRHLVSAYVPHIYKHPSPHCKGTSPF